MRLHVLTYAKKAQDAGGSKKLKPRKMPSITNVYKKMETATSLLTSNIIIVVVTAEKIKLNGYLLFLGSKFSTCGFVPMGHK